MKTIILAGGYGSRLSEYTDSIPKPMVSIGNKPILWHIMNSYAHFGHDDFYLALGYKAEVIKEYFLNYYALNSDFKINLSNGDIENYQQSKVNWNVTLVETGLNTMTGGRVKRLKKYIAEETFMLTYGDGLCNVDINELIAFHKNHGKMITVTAVRPSARFGEINIKNNKVIDFQEKPQISQGWVNGGFFIIEPEFFDLIKDDSTIFERRPLEEVSKMGELMAFHHSNFWQCMDTKRDRDFLEDLWDKGNAPWVF